jgi:hypothetical protein
MMMLRVGRGGLAISARKRQIGSMDDPTILSCDDLKAFAALKVSRLERSIDKVDGQFISVSGWLSASLFALNGGGALAAVGAAETIDQPGWPIGLFGLGLIFAMLSGVLVQHFTSSSSPQAEAMLRFWHAVARSGSADWEVMSGKMRALQRLERWFWTAPFTGWISGILFIIGGGALAVDQTHPAPGHVRICKRLQTKMLSPRPGTARELFETLKCKWQD